MDRHRKSSRTLLFARNFIRHPRVLGAILPSSRFLVERLLSRMDLRSARVVVEYGPGIGNVTQEILRRMRPDAVLVAIELNPAFVDFVRKELDDPRLRVVYGSAVNVRRTLRNLGLPQADIIISSLPFSMLPDDVRAQILSESREMLGPEGTFAGFQYSRALLPALYRLFGRVQQDFEFWNVLPARLFYCTR